MDSATLFVLFIVLVEHTFVVQARTGDDRSNEIVCRVPRYAPYFWVKDVSSTTMDLGITDPNKVNDVTSYTVYYWGYRFGAESTKNRADRDFGQRNMSYNGPFRITGLKPGFIYCADATANNNCGHGPFCLSCFENVVTLQDFN